MKKLSILFCVLFLISCHKSVLSHENLAFVEVKENQSESFTAKHPCPDQGHPMIWRADHGQSIVYLFGSIHLGKPEFYPLDPIIEEAYESSDHIVVEVNTLSDDFKNDIQQMMTAGMLEDGKKLPDVISVPVYKKLEERFNALGLPIRNFLTFKPWMMAITLTAMQLQALGYLPDFGVDHYLLEKAQHAGKHILQLETMEEQMRIFDQVDGELFLAYTLLSMNTFDAEMNQMINAWQCGRQKVLERIVLKDYSTQLPEVDQLFERLFYDRNQRMTRKIIQYLETDATYFLVVGAGHLIGDQGIVNLLIQKGYQIKRL